MDVTVDIPLDGICDPRFAAIRDAFRTNFVERGEPGAAVCVAIGGRVVVDLWGGWADRARLQPWARETLVNVFSVGKALSAIGALMLVERGALNLDAPIAQLWPKFGVAGKEAITLRHVLSHRAALPALRDPLPDGAMLDWNCMTRALAGETPWWPPGSIHGYHVNTFGYLLGEVMRRATGRTLGTILREDVARPLGADVHIGLAESELGRVAEFLYPNAGPAQPPNLSDDLELMRWNAYWNPPGLSGRGWVNTREWRLAEIPSANCHGTARGIARVYAAMANWGEIDGIRILSDETVRAAIREHSYGTDIVLQRSSRFGLGFQLTHPERPLGPNPHAFGHFGAGGSLGFCDPDAGVSFGYVTNDMGPRWQNPRNGALIEAVYSCL